MLMQRKHFTLITTKGWYTAMPRPYRGACAGMATPPTFVDRDWQKNQAQQHRILL